MNNADSELLMLLKRCVIVNLLKSERIEVVCFENEFYCAICFKNNNIITILRKTRDKPNLFNCPYCSELRIYDPALCV